jgi:7,8-dihydropterin-6-yl-methyl-4-(beta-D-ribofuranosyl)aminobenzene 5'-phosphate synthase
MAGQVRLAEADSVEVLTVVDNVADALLPNTDIARRLNIGGADAEKRPQAEAPLLEAGRAAESPAAEHGLSFLVTVTSGDANRTILFDTGSTAQGLVRNSGALGIDLRQVERVILSHGHYDHVMGLNGLAKAMSPLPALLIHPDGWLRRRVAVPGREPRELPVTSRDRVRAAGFELIERREPSLLLDDSLLVTGEIERVTSFEQGFPVHQALRDGDWLPDPLILDDQALVVNLRGRGLVVITGCGHSGIINTLRHARKLTGVERVYAVLGGFHLATSPLDSVIWPTVEALAEFAPEVIVPAHCTGWRATHAIAAAFPDAFVPNSVGTTYVLKQLVKSGG